MPIRMTDDPEGGDDERPAPRRRRSSGGDGDAGSAIVAVFSLLRLMWRWPKTSLALILGVVLWVMFADPTTASSSEYGAGATLDPKVYAESLVYEPLAMHGNAGLPERTTLIEYAPKRLNQGQQGSCVGWATSYAARTILHAKQTGRPPDEVAFSPSFLFNQIAAPNCNGSHIARAMETLERVGDLPFSDFAYDDSSCTRKPSGEEKGRARDYRIAGSIRLSLDADDFRTNADAIKQHLVQGAPVVIGMKVGGTFRSTHMRGKRVWLPIETDYAAVDEWTGHAMTVIGYDDLVEGGAFQVMNSWGPHWGEDGIAFIRYRDLDHFVTQAYGLYPMGEARRDVDEQRIRFGLARADDLRRLPVKRISDRLWRTVSPIRKGDRFKVEFSNTRPVFTYVFGQETDGSSYVLFPYTDKHSPYCGTTGTRVFPRRQSLTADEVGTRDSIAVVVSPTPLDYRALNEEITGARGSTYLAKLESALGPRLSRSARVRSVDQLVELASTETNPDKVHALVVEFDKR